MIDGFTTPDNHLRALFQHVAQNRTLNTSTASLTIDTETHAEIKISPRTPEQAASYMRYLLNTREPMFQRKEMQLTDQSVLPSPITFRVDGITYEPKTRLHFAVHMLRMRFFESYKTSELCFDFNFNREDWANPHSCYTGPTATDFIKLLEKAGTHWHNLFQYMPDEVKVARPNHLKIVK
ncbi:hypothetical protein [Micavibrio aeruginosavorus]|uniref:hypothetical protein n=1 Tax=Micavibrio aeruginosavorus TaxID=349221 RepID=UPI003F4A8AFC